MGANIFNELPLSAKTSDKLSVFMDIVNNIYV